MIAREAPTGYSILMIDRRVLRILSVIFAVITIASMVAFLLLPLVS
jgi:hypothetical protein